MNVLEIYPGHSWWLCGESREEIAKIRELLRQSPPEAESTKKAYCLVGDAAAFELIDRVFDEMIVRYPVGALKKLVLERQATRWLAQAGELRFEPDHKLLTAEAGF
jgi:hypothetical protein